MRAPKNTVCKARALRRNLSIAEMRLWRRLRTRLLGQPVFPRQPIGRYVLDFYCAKAKLAVEIDGISHDMGDRPRHDIRREAWLGKQGLTVVHIPAGELIYRVDETADAIVRLAAERL